MLENRHTIHTLNAFLSSQFNVAEYRKLMCYVFFEKNNLSKPKLFD